MALSSVETEIKLVVSNRRVLAARLRRLGFRLKHRRTFEANTVLDTSSLSIRSGGSLLRLREFGAARILTYKGPPVEGRHKSREEVEIAVSDLGSLETIFERLGFRPVFRYEKFRTEWEDGDGVATLDETPIGEFLELEGTPEWIDQRAEELGYRETDYITKSYGRLYFEHREANAGAPSYMIFRQTPERT
jgi:adenylate cyclase class 2